jgi:hypothetical protein
MTPLQRIQYIYPWGQDPPPPPWWQSTTTLWLALGVAVVVLAVAYGVKRARR